MNSDTREKLLPFLLTIGVIVADQVTKALIVANVPMNPFAPSGVIEVFGDFFRIIHRRNLAVAFSLGHSFPDAVKFVLFKIVPLFALGGLTVYYWKSSDFTKTQRWCFAGIVGGGLGNLIDRFFRPAGVVDFLDVKFYGLFGMERWPTFNIADSAVVVCAILLFVTLLFTKEKNA